jgi:hypothetical protein
MRERGREGEREREGGRERKEERETNTCTYVLIQKETAEGEIERENLMASLLIISQTPCSPCFSSLSLSLCLFLGAQFPLLSLHQDGVMHGRCRVIPGGG